MQSAIKIVKPVDTEQKAVTMPPIADRDFWIEQRHALLMQLTSIERKLGIVYQRCPHCNKRNRVETG